MDNTSVLSNYLEKQKKFISLIKEVQSSLISKEYKKQEAYRYLICGKVIDQLEEFEIKPAYERLCQSLHNLAKTPVQMKLLWSTILKETGGRPDCINSTHIKQFWKNLCKNEKYSSFCLNEEDIMSKIEISLNKFSYEKKQKQLHSIKQMKQPVKSTTNNTQVSTIPSPCLSESELNNHKQSSISILKESKSVVSMNAQTNIPVNLMNSLNSINPVNMNINMNMNSINMTLSPLSNCSPSLSYNETSNNYNTKFQSNLNTVSFQNEITCSYLPLTNLPQPQTPQQQYYYIY